MAGALAVPAFRIGPQARPQLPDGIQVGDPLQNRAIVWARADRPSRLIVEYATTESFQNVRRVRGPLAIAASDFTARVDLQDLPPDQKISFRASFEGEDGRTTSEPGLQ